MMSCTHHPAPRPADGLVSSLWQLQHDASRRDATIERMTLQCRRAHTGVCGKESTRGTNMNKRYREKVPVPVRHMLLISCKCVNDASQRQQALVDGAGLLRGVIDGARSPHTLTTSQVYKRQLANLCTVAHSADDKAHPSATAGSVSAVLSTEPTDCTASAS